MHADADFLAAIRANPDDDALRLVYADWLEERGNVRGELLRLELLVDRTAHHDLHELARLQELQHTLDREWVLKVGRANFGRVAFMLPATSDQRIFDPSWSVIEGNFKILNQCHSGFVFLRLDYPDGNNYLSFTRITSGFSFEGRTIVGTRYSDLVLPGEEQRYEDVETVLRVAKYAYYFGDFDPSFRWAYVQLS